MPSALLGLSDPSSANEIGHIMTWGWREVTLEGADDVPTFAPASRAAFATATDFCSMPVLAITPFTGSWSLPPFV
eukprot:348429-Prymnesium_polylepis.1